MSRMRARTVLVMSANASFAVVVTSPTTCTCPVVTNVSTATRERGSSASSASRTESLIASQILSGCPSVTDSLVNKRPFSLTPSSFQITVRLLVRQIISLRRPAALGQPWMLRVLGGGATAPVQERNDCIHDTTGHQRLRPVLQRRFGTVGCQQPAVVVVHLEGLALTDGIHHQQVTALAPQLCPGMEQHIAVRVARLGGEADDRPHVGQLPGGA